MNELALFAGAGGGLLATTHLLKWETVCYVEWDDYCIDVLKQRIQDGYLHDAPIWDDVRTFDGHPWAGCVDIVTAGFPCQPFSTAGKRNGHKDERNMWPSTIRIIREVRPTWVLLENVPGLLSAMDDTATLPHSYFGTVLGDLAQSGYDARWRVLSAAELGALHKRDRVFVVAYAQEGRDQRVGRAMAKAPSEAIVKDDGSKFDSCRQDVAYAKSKWGRQSATGPGRQMPTRRGQKSRQCNGWSSEPQLARLVDGIPDRVDRQAAIGNGQVPAVVAAVWGLLTEV